MNNVERTSHEKEYTSLRSTFNWWLGYSILFAGLEWFYILSGSTLGSVLDLLQKILALLVDGVCWWLIRARKALVLPFYVVSVLSQMTYTLIRGRVGWWSLIGVAFLIFFTWRMWVLYRAKVLT